MRLFARKETKAETERKAKQKVDADRGRTEDFRSRLESIFFTDMVQKKKITAEEADTLRRLQIGTVQKAASVSAVPFDVTAIDNKVSELTGILEETVKGAGSFKTVLRCFQGIAYGLMNAREPIPAGTNSEEVLETRENILSIYSLIAGQSLTIDKNREKIVQTEEKEKHLELEQDRKKTEFKQMVKENPKVYFRLKDLTPGERDSVTGDMRQMADAQKQIIYVAREIENTKQNIGKISSVITELEHTIEQLNIQMSQMDSVISYQNMAEIQRLTKVFQQQLQNDEERIEQLRKENDTLDKAIDIVLAGAKTKEDLITTGRLFDDLMDKEVNDQIEDEQARKRLDQEEKEKEKRIQNALAENEEQEEENSILEN